MKTVRVKKEDGLEYDITIMSHQEIAQAISGTKDGYSIICSESDFAIKIYERTNGYFNKFKTKIGKLYFDINTDTVYYSQYGFPTINNCVGIYKDIFNQLRNNDVIILRGKTSSITRYRTKAGILRPEIPYFLSDKRYIYVPLNFVRRFHKGDKYGN